MMAVHRSAAMRTRGRPVGSLNKNGPVQSSRVPDLAMAVARARAREIGGRVVVRSDGTVLVANH